MAEEKKGQGKQEMAPAERGREVQRITPSRAVTPFEEMDRMFDRMFESFFPRGWMQPLRWERPAWREALAEARVPRVDVIDREDDILVRAEIPGVTKDNLEITTTENTVTIKGSSEREAEEEQGGGVDARGVGGAREDGQGAEADRRGDHRRHPERPAAPARACERWGR